MPSLEKLFTRPYLWGTSPSEPRWSKSGAVLVFLWNAEGRQFRDLYAWRPNTDTPVRLSDLEHTKGSLNAGEAEKDERRKRYLPPQPGISEFALSSDGTRAAFSWHGDLFVADTSGRTPLLRLTHTKAPETAPQFSPDASRLASLRGGQVVIQDLRSGQIEQVTDFETGRLESYQWSPDGALLLCQVVRGEPRQSVLPNYSGKTVTARSIPRSLAGDEPLETDLVLVPVGGGEARTISRVNTKAPLATTEWSHDGKHILIAQHDPDYKRRSLIVVSADTTKSTVVFEETDPRWVDYGYAGWSEDDTAILFTSERDGWAHLYRTGLNGGEPVQLTRGPFEIRSEPFSMDPRWAGGYIWFSSNEGDSAQRLFYRVRPDGSGKERVGPSDGVVSGIVSEDGKRVALLRADEKTPFELWADGKRVTTSPRPEFASVTWPQMRYVRFSSRGDRKAVAARLLLPPGYDPRKTDGRKWPAVIYVHGAGIATSVLKQWGSYNEFRYVYNAYLTSLGYVVLEPDYRGSTGYGRDWRSDVYLHLGGKDLEDVLGGVDYLKSLGNIDTGRLGIWGVSYGGFMTAMALFQSPGTFRAGAAWAGVYDWENYNATYTRQRLNTPKSDPEAYRRSSPVNFSQDLKDSLLIVHGMVDNNVLFQDAVQLTEKLIREGKRFDHIYYPEESHGFVRDETWIDAFRRTTEWFERYLK